jgi:DDE superfamily endonuclease
MVKVKKESKHFDINCRHSLALTGHDRRRKKVAMSLFMRLVENHGVLIANNDGVAARRTRRFMKMAIAEYVRASTVEIPVYIRFAGERLRIFSASLEDGKIGVDYRFKTRAQIKTFYECFQIPAVFVIPEVGYRFHGEELLLLALERCATGARYVDLQEKYHVHHGTICRGINHFAKWMNEKWGYLLRDNFAFWKPHLRTSNLAIKEKLLTKYNFNCDERLGEDFLVAMFIDCTIIPTCRPGGGPMAPGPNAPRYPYLIQEAYYNGWKKAHGIKKQAIGLANGMAFQVSEGYSCRRHDLHLLGESDIDDRLFDLTLGDAPSEHYTCYGDSAYPEMLRISCSRDGEDYSDYNKAMNGCRESIEWMFRDLGQYWKIIGNKNAFKLLLGFEKADNLIDLCFNFGNAWNAMNYNLCSQWFECRPPSIQECTSNGPRENVAH